MNVVTAIQARTSSSRLPNKILFPLCGEPLILRMVDRVKNAHLSGTVVLATSDHSSDDILYDLCQTSGIPCFRGNMLDLLDRHYQLALNYHAEAIVKIPSDCPLIDPQIIDRILSYYLENKDIYDYVSNLHPASYPDGNDVEVMSFSSLEKAWKSASRQLEREHTTPYIWENPDIFRIGNVLWENGKDFSTSHRWTIDYEEDYQFIEKIYEILFPKNPAFGLQDILELIEAYPDIAQINDKYKGHYWYMNHLNELNTINSYKNKISNK